MSKGLNRSTVSLSYALTKDIAGNLLTGNDHRAMIYLKALNKSLEALLEKLDAGNDVRAERKLEATLRTIRQEMDEAHAAVPHDETSMGTSLQQWEERGFSMSDFAQPLDADVMAEVLAQNGIEIVDGKLVRTGKAMGEA
ncbi:hypothetical protein [Noviherbaspirillum pedocola]|uniref:Uncharacterized protein n=1 Tax=Noviherbaspirillum pedocola TaxID=2801341 RepID=A0A934W3N5_9BURK|nr:hypothetical protein [Noviherbaspirillum pedocola]MBK4733032.1 hypothetical protein [Noviherbaspirillum pedocola]